MSLAARPRTRAVVRVLVGLAAWAVVALSAFAVLFLHERAPLVVASHDATVQPVWSRYSRIELGPYLPDVRLPHHGHLGARIVLGKTAETQPEELVRRYALLAEHPDAEERRITSVIRALAVEAGLRAGLVGLLPIGVWLLLGPQRRRELLRRPGLDALVGVSAIALVVLAIAQPWRGSPERVRPVHWIPLSAALPDVPIPDQLRHVQVASGLITGQTRHFIASGLDSYRRSLVFYRHIEQHAEVIAPLLRKPGNDETLAVLVSDRHDNISMDPVVRRVAQLTGATVVIDAGDDTSTGDKWEAFSLDSLDEAFESLDEHVFIAGNHDHGGFVDRHLRNAGWTHLADKAREVAGIRLLGLDDPRASGLGAWRDERGPLSFQQVADRLADTACKDDEEGDRVATLVVHDPAMGRPALDRGCVDLVLSGHIHHQIGPTLVHGSNGSSGYTYTNGTTGGAAYAIAIGGKLRRDAQFTLVTYRGGRPLGLQPVTVTTAGEYVVAPFVSLPIPAQPK